MMRLLLHRSRPVLATIVALIVGSVGAMVNPGPVINTMAAPASAPDNSIALVPFVGGFSAPVFIGNAGDGSGRLFVVEQGGRIKIVRNGLVNASPFLDVSSSIVAGDEKGPRLDVDNGGTPLPPDYTYTIPPTNPFVGQAGARPEIWALGFRNPYRWSFDRQTGEMLIGDVGHDAWNEIDVIPPGAGGLNFGWDDREGAHCYEPMSGCLVAGRSDPILEYSHASNGPPCSSVTGGYRYRDAQNLSLRGTYIYGDFCTGRIWKGLFQRSGDGRAGVWTAVEALDTEHLISSFGEDEAGELYLLSFGGSSFRIVEPTPPLSCSVRPNVVVQSTRIGTGTLGVTLGVSDNATVPSNQLQSITFTRIDNAFVTIGSQIDRTAPFSTTFASGTRSVSLTVRRDRSNEPFQGVFTATDRCGPWPGFVGAGRGFP
jgi:hypothetical protein